MKQRIFYALMLLAAPLMLLSQDNANEVTGVWYNEEKDARFEIYEEDGAYFGRIIWLKEPLDPETGEPKVDDENPEEALQSRPLKGLVFMKDFVFEEKGLWEDGEIYDPKSGKTYDCYLKLETPDKLKVRGYVGISLLGRTSKWTRAKK